ncbi:hypothetical protein XENTR_v10015631 [Xenopus tropicalis]|nr:gastrula zinc finger protein XlCGF8.2DB isoform X2 [Xenopus tropicalis]XP_031760162.1 gastrula zinc finger protein XlCGF8.2DB isoform X2 [Xenopus tropicalis]KAE8595217.1 hypothetical protein XENTR_v10015631 [Xenopus tropicalis]|eukprot:XP_012808789.1 PREDICTED: gastrula zinc finger protein XlCGF8.2DB-like isoform X2 [Xenopus tropicalis]
MSQIKEEDLDSKDHLKPMESSAVPLTHWASPKTEPEILQIKIKEEEPDPNDDLMPPTMLLVTHTDGENCLNGEVNRCPEAAQLGTSDGCRAAQHRAHTQFTVFSASAEEPRCNCCKCGRMFSSSGDLATHHCANALYDSQSRDAALVGQFHCTECGKSFAHKVGIAEHAKLHTGGKPFPCTECGKAFARKSSFQNHQETHVVANRPFTCGECGRGFAQKVTLRLHQNVHTGEKPFTCTECGRSFSKKDNLRRHSKLHVVQKTCSQCGKYFTQTRFPYGSPGLSPFTCLECQKKNHIREMPLRCAKCGDGFYRRNHLTIHQKVHEREKTFGCKDCGEAFPEKKQLKKHQGIHSKGREVEGAGVPETD